MRDCCFICSLPSYDFEHHGGGFYKHYHLEHNMWAYIYYFIYLNNTSLTEHTALDLYVHRLVGKTSQFLSTLTSFTIRSILVHTGEVRLLSS